MIEATTIRGPVCACAVDSVLLIRQSARRMLCAVQEYRGSMVIVPAEAARESPKVYQNVAAKQARRESRATARAMQGEWSEKERKPTCTGPGGCSGTRKGAGADTITHRAGQYGRAAANAGRSVADR